MSEKTLESPLDCKEIQPIHSEGDHPWDFFGRNDAKAETPVLWPPHAKSWIIGKDSDAGRDWGQEEKGTTEDEMAGWHHWLDGHESEWALGVGDGQGGLACCDSWACKESDMTERLIWSDLSIPLYIYNICIYIYIIFIRSSVNGYFYILAIINTVTINIGVHIFFQIRAFPQYMPKNGTAWSYGNSIFSILRNLHSFPYWLH